MIIEYLYTLSIQIEADYLFFRFEFPFASIRIILNVIRDKATIFNGNN